ncbi:unnamed protein product, partial [Symbiodinium sp. KB8]
GLPTLLLLTRGRTFARADGANVEDLHRILSLAMPLLDSTEEESLSRHQALEAAEETLARSVGTEGLEKAARLFKRALGPETPEIETGGASPRWDHGFRARWGLVRTALQALEAETPQSASPEAVAEAPPEERVEALTSALVELSRHHAEELPGASELPAPDAPRCAVQLAHAELVADAWASSDVSDQELRILRLWASGWRQAAMTEALEWYKMEAGVDTSGLVESFLLPERWQKQAMARRWIWIWALAGVLVTLFEDGSGQQTLAADRGGTEPVIPDSSSMGGRAQGVQALLNPARKAEQRLQKLHATKARIASQFSAFLRGLKKSFVKEMSKFQSDTARIEQAIAEAEQEQERTFETVRTAILGGSVELPGGTQPASSVENMWDQMRATWEKEDGALLQEVLRRGQRAPGPPVTTGRQLSQDAQQLLAYFGATNAPIVAAPAAAAGPPGSTDPRPHSQLSPELMQLLSHFGAADTPTAAPTVNEGYPQVVPPGNGHGGLDPSLFAPCAGVQSGAIHGGDTTPSTSISPGAKARRALATPSQPRKPLKAHTKPPTATPGQGLSEKLAKIREAAAVREAMAAAGLVPPAEAMAPPGLGMQAPQMTPPGEASQLSGGPGTTNAMRRFGRPVSYGISAEGTDTAPLGGADTRSIEIREGTEDEMEDAVGDGQ